MRLKLSIVAALAVLAVCGIGLGPQAVGVAHAACDPGDKIDGSTAAQASKKIGAAGFTQVHELKKGCDNYWHGKAMKDGAETRVSLAPDGVVRTEGD